MSEILKFVARWDAAFATIREDLRARKAKTLETGVDHMGGQTTDGISAFLTNEGDPFGGPEDNKVPVVVGIWPLKLCAKRMAENPRFRLSTAEEISAFNERSKREYARFVEEESARAGKQTVTLIESLPPTKASTK